jgi:IS5 family transposase
LPKDHPGRRPVGLALMLRTYFLQQWFNLSDPGVEEALYESPVLRRLVGVDLGVAAPPDETTVCRFRHLLEEHDLGGQMLEAVNLHLERKASASRRERSWTRRSSRRLRRPGTGAASAIPRCTRRRRANNGVCHEHERKLVMLY